MSMKVSINTPNNGTAEATIVSDEKAYLTATFTARHKGNDHGSPAAGITVTQNGTVISTHQYAWENGLAVFPERVLILVEPGVTRLRGVSTNDNATALGMTLTLARADDLVELD